MKIKEVYIISETIGEFSDAQTSPILAAKSLELAQEKMAALKLEWEIMSECVYWAMDIWRRRKPKGGDYSQVDYIAWIDQAPFKHRDEEERKYKIDKVPVLTQL